jgi:hypothetical protein
MRPELVRCVCVATPSMRPAPRRIGRPVWQLILLPSAQEDERCQCKQAQRRDHAKQNAWKTMASIDARHIVSKKCLVLSYHIETENWCASGAGNVPPIQHQHGKDHPNDDERGDYQQTLIVVHPRLRICAAVDHLVGAVPPGHLHQQSDAMGRSLLP